MAISFPITLPATPVVQSVTITPVSVVAASRSPFTLERQTQVHQGQLWQAELVYPTMARAEGEPVVASIVSLNGQEGTFLLGDPAGATPRGSASITPGTPLVKGASQTGQDINFDGAPNNATGYLLAGDWVSLGTGASTRLYKVLADANSDGSGNFTLTLWPDVVTASVNDAALTVSSAKGVFALTENANPWDVDPSLAGGAFNLAFAAMSVV